MRPQVGQLVNNKYRLLRLIGEGGMGTVFEARHEALGTSVALKFLHSELSRRQGLVQRFLQEARVVARIQSPHVVRVSDVDQTGEGLAFIVMEFIEGKSLQALYEELYRQGKRLSYVDALDYAMQLLDGLEAAHAAGIVHRDLKPDNVMVTRAGKGHVLLKILDFGIAKLKVEGDATKGLTRPGVVMGTPEYMAPEQAFSADQVDARADIFAFGVMFFEMLAGRRPVGGDEPHQIAAQYLAGEFAKLTDLAPTVPAGLAAVVHKAMAAQTKDRWASVVELRDAIEPYQEAKRSSGLQAKSEQPRNEAPALRAENPASAPAQVMAAVGAGAVAAASPAPLSDPPRRVARTHPGEVDGGSTDKVDGPPAMMLGRDSFGSTSPHAGTAEGLGPHTPPPATAMASPSVIEALEQGHAVSAASARPPLARGTDISSPDLIPPGMNGASAAWGATELAPYDPFPGRQVTATEGYEPFNARAPRPGGTELRAAGAAGAAIHRGVGQAGPPLTPVGFAAPPQRARKKSNALGWLLFLAMTLTGGVLGVVFLWDHLDEGEGNSKNKKPAATTPAHPATPPGPAAPPQPTPVPPPPPQATPAPTPPRPQPQPQPQPRPQPQPQPQPSATTPPLWTIPSALPTFFPIPRQNDPPAQPSATPTNPRPAPSAKPRPSNDSPWGRVLPKPKLKPRGTDNSTENPAPKTTEERPRLKPRKD